MANSYTAPRILGTSPGWLETNVNVGSKIVLDFSKDMDAATVNTNTFVVTALPSGTKVTGTVTYEDREATFTPSESLATSTTYQVSVIGDTDLNDTASSGVQDILGVSLVGIYSFTFTTTVSAIVSPTLLSPANETRVSTVPTLRWGAVTGATQYAVQTSVYKDFSTITWATLTTDTQVNPNGLQRGVYYWRVQATDSVASSAWSTVWDFLIAEEEQSGGAQPVSPSLTVLGYNPKQGSTNIPLSSSLRVKFDKSIDPTTVTSDTVFVIKLPNA